MLLLLVTGIKLESGSKGIEPASYTCLLSKVQAVTAVHAKHGQGRVIRARHRSGGEGSETLVGPGTRGRHCSNCGSAAVGCQRLAEPPSARSGWQPRIRAVLPHNAAYELDRGSRLLDAIIPCLGPDRTCMRPVVLRGVTVRQLLYLTLRTEARAVCSICQQRQAPEDARDEPHLFSSCLEVELPPGERCAGCRLYQTRYGTPAAQAHPPGEAGGGFSRQSPAS